EARRAVVRDALDGVVEDGASPGQRRLAGLCGPAGVERLGVLRRLLDELRRRLGLAGLVLRPGLRFARRDVDRRKADVRERAWLAGVAHDALPSLRTSRSATSTGRNDLPEVLGRTSSGS